MRFEGTVAISAEPETIWSVLTDVAVFERIAPGVESVEILVPGERFRLVAGTWLGKQFVSAPVEIVWDSCVFETGLHWSSATKWGGETITAHGEIHVGVADGVAFSAEIPTPPRNIPPRLIHNIASRTIRDLFTNLKRELEAVNSRQLSVNP